ncbi:MAG: 4Fe-4S dicluster domain-containing protein [Nitrospirae bacterium]|nr:4Fe-4S dicluster domain-containing protein [Nitrospirota bacterium]
MNTDDEIYRLLQRHLDSQAVGFPAAGAGADVRLLKRLFTPDEARVALCLSYKPAPDARINELPDTGFSPGQIRSLLNTMFSKGAVGWKKKDGTDHWYLMPLLIGMYEAQDGDPSLDFLGDAEAYMKTMGFAMSFLSVRPSQMRTIPINRSLAVEHHVATYDQIRAIVRDSPGPFVVLKCICRQGKALKDKPCSKTRRQETCLAMGDMASAVLRRNHGRQLTRDEVLSVLQQNEDDGLVLQPANAQNPEFVCSCCGCCCGMLSYQKFLPAPVGFWANNYFAEVDAGVCAGCGACVARCQVNAVALAGASGGAEVNLNRCIGCGLCVTTCPSEAIRLKKKAPEVAPPLNEEALYDEIMANKSSGFTQLRTLLKAALRLKQ